MFDPSKYEEIKGTEDCEYYLSLLEIGFERATEFKEKNSGRSAAAAIVELSGGKPPFRTCEYRPLVFGQKDGGAVNYFLSDRLGSTSERRSGDELPKRCSHGSNDPYIVLESAQKY